MRLGDLELAIPFAEEADFPYAEEVEFPFATFVREVAVSQMVPPPMSAVSGTVAFQTVGLVGVTMGVPTWPIMGTRAY